MANHNPRNQFVKGNNANPNGRPPKGYSITETVKEMLNSKPEIKQALATKVLEYALKGDVAAMKMLWQYMDGMPEQSVNHGGGITVEGVVIYKPEKNIE